MKKVLLSFILIAAMSLPSFAQSFRLGLTGGVTSIQSPDSYTDDPSDGGMGFGSSAHYGLKAKLGLPLLPLTVTGQLIRTSFSNEVNNVDIDQSLLIFGAGIEWGILPIPGPINPYVALDLFYSNFGDVEYTYNNVEYNQDGFSRTGLGIGAGVEFTMLPKIDLEASAKYNFNNLIGQEDDEESMNTINISFSVLYSLN